MKGEMKEDLGHTCLRGIVGLGLQRIELRDEIYCQLYRQTNGNPHRDYQLRLWLLWCLCSVCIHPSRTLKKVSILYYVAASLFAQLCETRVQYTWGLRYVEKSLPWEKEQITTLSVE